MAGACRISVGRQINRLFCRLPSCTPLCEKSHHTLGSPPRTLPSRHIFSSSAPKGGGDLLLSSLQAQIKRENLVSFSQESLSPPLPFKLVSSPYAKELILRRTFGEEEIEITCVFHDQTVGENEGEERLGPPPPPDVPMKMVQMTIKISVGTDRPFLEIVCCQFGTKASIEQVLLRDNVGKLKEAPYEGPDISMLSDKLKSGFVEFLEARGIDNEFGKFLLKFVPQTTQQKTASWLNKVQRFLNT